VLGGRPAIPVKMGVGTEGSGCSQSWEMVSEGCGVIGWLLLGPGWVRTWGQFSYDS